jgi:acetoin utilization protein AcuB
LCPVARHRMKRIPLIKTIMTPFPYAVDMDDTLDSAKRMMVDHNIHHLPVTEKGKPAGVISNRDIKKYAKPGKLHVRDIANVDTYVVDLAVPLDTVLVEMARRHIHTGLVVRGGRLVGIFTATDVFVYLARLLGSFFPRDSDDAA